MLLNGTNFQEIARLESPVPEHLFHLAFNHDATQLAACISGGVELWDLALMNDRLREMQLDWDATLTAIARSKEASLELDVDTGDSRETVSRGERNDPPE